MRVDDAGSTVTQQANPVLAIGVDGAVFALWEDHRGSGIALFLAKSINGGRSFGPSLVVDPLKPNLTQQRGAAITVGPEGRVYIAWSEDRDTSFDTDIYLARSDDGGLSFQPPVRVDDSGDSRTVQRTPSIAVDGRGYVYLAWQDARRRVGTTPSGSPVYTADIYLARSVDAGVSFTASVRVDDAGDAYVWHSWPSVAWSPEGILMVSWHDNRTGANSVYAANSRDGGQTFGQSVRMDDAPLATAQGLSSLSADHKGLFYSVWLDNRLGDWSIFSTRSVDGGISFKPNVRVDVGGSKSLTGTVPRLAAHEGGFLASVWTDWTPSLSDRDIYIAASRDRGVSFEGAFRVDQGPAGSDQVSPSVAVDEVGRAYVIWADDRNSPETDPHYDVYLSVLDFGLPPPLEVTLTLGSLEVVGNDTLPMTVEVRRPDGLPSGALPLLFASDGGNFSELRLVAQGVWEGSYQTVFVPETFRGLVSAFAEEQGYLPSSASASVLVHAPLLSVVPVTLPNSLKSGETADVQVRVEDPRGPFEGAQVVGWCDGGAMLSPSDGLTAQDGSFATTFLAPILLEEADVDCELRAKAENRFEDVLDLVVHVYPLLRISLRFSSQVGQPGQNITVEAIVTDGVNLVEGAAVVFGTDSGKITPWRGMSDASGVFHGTYTLPSVNETTPLTVFGRASKSGYGGGETEGVLRVVGPEFSFWTSLDREETFSRQGVTIVAEVWFGGSPAEDVFVALKDDMGGSLMPWRGFTDASGRFVSRYVPPEVANNTVGNISVVAFDRFRGVNDTVVRLLVKPTPADELHLSVFGRTFRIFSGENLNLTTYVTYDYAPVGDVLVTVQVSQGSISPWKAKSSRYGLALFQFAAPAVTDASRVTLSFMAYRRGIGLTEVFLNLTVYPVAEESSTSSTEGFDFDLLGAVRTEEIVTPLEGYFEWQGRLVETPSRQSSARESLGTAEGESDD